MSEEHETSTGGPASTVLSWRDRSDLGREVLAALGPVIGLTALIPLVAEERESGVLVAMFLTVVLPLALRTSWPAAVLMVTCFGTVATAVSTGSPVIQVLSVALASYTLGERTSDRTQSALFVLSMAALISLGTIAQDAEPFEAIAVSFVVLVPAWVLGDLLRTRRLEAARRTEALERSSREREAALRAAADDERRRVARELHDIVAHTVSVMVVQAGAARQVVQSAPDKAEQSLAAVEATGRQAMAELRGFVGALGDAEAGDSEPGGMAPQPGLGELSTLVTRVRDAGLPVELEVDGSPRTLSPTLDVTAYRIVQEALTNALRYANRAATLVHLTYESEQLRVEILDDGPADAPPAVGSGRGLIGMEERAALVGGRLEVGPRLGGGFAVRAWLPFEARPG